MKASVSAGAAEEVKRMVTLLSSEIFAEKEVNRFACHGIRCRNTPEKILPDRAARIIVDPVHFYNAERLDDFPALGWLVNPFAGLNRVTAAQWELFARRGIAVTSSKIFGVPIAEHILGLMLCHCRRFAQFRSNQLNGIYEKSVGDGMRLLHGSSVLILGTGAIGGELSARLRPFGARIIGMNRTGRAVPGFDRIISADGLGEALPEADYVVLALPLTAETRSIMDAHRLGLCKEGCFLVNVGRGDLIDEAALIGELKSGRLGGAGLDVFSKEPLPAGSPLYGLENCLLTPHVSGQGLRNRSRMVQDGILRNLSAFVAGTPLEMPDYANARRY